MMKIIGLTGRTGAGKSVVGSFLATKGGFIIDADKVWHHITERGKPAYELVVSAFGRHILSRGGEIDRKKLGAIVFNDEEKLKRLSEISHPLVKAEIAEIARRASPIINRFVVLEAPLLYEAGWEDMCDAIIIIDAEENLRAARIMTRDAIKVGDAISRVKAQTTNLRSFSKENDLVVENNGALDAVFNEVECWLENALK